MMKFKNYRGFTLTEVLVTMVISSFLFISIGTLMVGMHVSIMKAEGDVALNADYRFIKLIVKKELRAADNIIFMGGAGIEKIRYSTIYGDLKAIQLDTDTDEVKIVNLDSGEEIFIAQFVKYLSFQYIDLGPDYKTAIIEIKVEQEKIGNQQTGSVLYSSGTFNVYLRNVK